MFLSCFFGHSESEAKAAAPAVSGKQEHNECRCGMLFLSGLCSDQYQRSDVVFESPATPTVLYQLSLTGNMSGAYLRGENRRALTKICTQLGGEKETSCQNVAFN